LSETDTNVNTLARPGGGREGRQIVGPLGTSFVLFVAMLKDVSKRVNEARCHLIGHPGSGVRGHRGGHMSVVVVYDTRSWSLRC